MSSAIPPLTLLRLAGISHAKLPPSTATAAELEPIIKAILAEAIPFIDTAAPKSDPVSTTWMSKGTKTYPSSDSPVTASALVITGRPTETWFARRSVHADLAERGTASWAEFDRSFRTHHAESEKGFSGTVIGARKALAWSAAEGVSVDVGGERWVDHRLSVVEMKHKVSSGPLKHRVFPVLLLASAVSGGEKEFVIVSVPVLDIGETEQSVFAKEKDIVVAAYASVERIRVFKEGDQKGEIEWIMATVSDAKGVLPQWVQNLAVPGMLPRDVDEFMAWILEERKKAAAT